ncbi:hypothetical protein LOZ61_003087 [Ophidiomyces ophidiicola]|uniref:Uncharacterized protein n=1 Tax=Ophidiomyces ophidiicola TaxID=1387563 RepID=A0ACB8V387_9EURO|nr:hypothetical protein LOZ61_003087 [Ophidiomyces ophidiicola]KAI1917572.1 hypothetical protein LOZ64_003052 [Ophidiomyces ophidiicola]KAI1930754.1 hypothetical protein LOZ60_000730 [Ophidiomyces ophidiicola]KAI1962235.1 hypothetical protein LOZ59_002065 [Ophidiomyces ophidiicola]KAI1976128.1 hypothetical protein LOZ56_000167 [Ophidiomyces ophidiicola]
MTSPSDPSAVPVPSSSGNDVTAHPSSSKATIDGLQKKRSLHRIPSKFSFHRQQKETSSGLGDPAQGDPEATPQTSRTNLTKKKRSNSKSSSVRNNAPGEATAVSIPAAANMGEKSIEKKPKGPSKLFAFLNCCSSQNDDGDGPILPPKKTTKAQVSHERQAAVVEKPEPSAAESSMADSRDPLPFDEKAALKANIEQESSKSEAEVGVPKRSEDGSIAASKLPVNSDATSGSPSSGASQPEASNSVPDDSPKTIVAPAVSPIEEHTILPQSPDVDEKAVPEPAGTTPIDVPTEEKPIPALPAKDDEKIPLLPLPPPPADPLQQTSDTQAPPVPVVPLDKKQYLLPPLQPQFKDKKCLVLDLDETLVHSSFKILDKADFTIPVEIEGQYHNIYVIKRPGVDQFMKRVGELYEVVVFTASVSKYGDPLLDQLDIHKVVHHRLFRDSCYNHQGNYVKDLSQVGRDLKDTIIIDNSPTSYIFHPQHAIPISSWFSDAHDNELIDLIPVLEDLASSKVRDVSLVLDVAL